MSGSDDAIHPLPPTDLDNNDENGVNDIDDTRSEPARNRNGSSKNGNSNGMTSIVKRGQSVMTMGKHNNKHKQSRQYYDNKKNKNDSSPDINSVENGHSSNSSGHNVNNHSPLANNNGNGSNYGSVKNYDQGGDTGPSV